MTEIFPRVLSRPLRVVWGGWQSDTYTLQKRGWEIAAEQNMREQALRLVLRHREWRLYGISQRIDFDFRRIMSNPFGDVNVTIDIVHMASDLVIQMHEMGPMAFKMIDAMPQYVETRITRIEDFGFFTAPLVRTQELIVDPEKIGEVLERIRQAQLPEQEAIRRRTQSRESRDAMFRQVNDLQQFHAQIISIAA